MIAHIPLLAMVGNMVAINDAGRNPHPLLNKYHARTSSSSGNAFLLNDGARGERYNERKHESGAEMCPPPAHQVFKGQRKWCICSGGSTCKGMECFADKWDPEKVISLLFFSLFFKKVGELIREICFHLSLKMGTLAHSAALCSLPARLKNLYSLKCHVSIFSLLSDRSSNSAPPRFPPNGPHFYIKLNLTAASLNLP